MVKINREEISERLRSEQKKNRWYYGHGTINRPQRVRKWFFPILRLSNAAAGCQLLVVENASWVVFGCLPVTAVWCIRRPHTPTRSVTRFRGLVGVDCGGLQLWLSASYVQTSRWDLLFILACSESWPASATPYMSRCGPPLRKCGRPTWREPQAVVDDTLSWRTYSLLRHKPAEVKGIMSK